MTEVITPLVLSLSEIISSPIFWVAMFCLGTILIIWFFSDKEGEMRI